MRKHSICWLLPATLAWATATATAQGNPDFRPLKPLSDPLDASAKVPALRHESPFGSHRRIGDAEAVAWREANDEVGRIGGWRAYAREANAPEPAADTAAARKPAPAAESASMPVPGALPSGHGSHPGR